jgi:hypothetical protein
MAPGRWFWAGTWDGIEGTDAHSDAKRSLHNIAFLFNF